MDGNVLAQGLEEQVMQIDGVKIFTSTRWHEINELGEKLTEWKAAQPPSMSVVDVDIRQSSDSERHCFTIVLWLAFDEETDD